MNNYLLIGFSIILLSHLSPFTLEISQKNFIVDLPLGNFCLYLKEALEFYAKNDESRETDGVMEDDSCSSDTKQYSE